MPLLDLQRRGLQIGRLRIGQQLPTGKNDSKGRPIFRPAALATFRFTTGSRLTADAVADYFGGDTRPWERGQFEVITDRDAIPITVPPRDEVVSQWYELWTGGGCQRRCNGEQEQRTGQLCQCPKDLGERAAKAALNPPQACRIVTRVNVMIPDLPGLGVWRLDTHSYYAAIEIADAARLMEMARDRGIFLPAMLRIDQRERVADGRTKRDPVPVIDHLASFRQIATGQLEAAGITAQLPPAPGEPVRAITTGTPAGPDAPVPAAEPAAPASPADDVDADTARYQEAQRIASLAADVTTADEWKALKQRAGEQGVLDEYVCADPETDLWIPLRDVLDDVWRARARAGSAR